MSDDTPQISDRPGDDGRSQTLGGSRRAKSDSIFEALGDIDELNSYLGVVRLELLRRGSPADALVGIIKSIQPALMTLSSAVAAEPGGAGAGAAPGIGIERIAALESEERRLRALIEAPGGFVIPGERGGVPQLDVARAISRRCERRVVRVMLDRGGADERLPLCQRYLNRLADLLFVAARYCETLSP